jgi:hypothetical protein
MQCDSLRSRLRCDRSRFTLHLRQEAALSLLSLGVFGLALVFLGMLLQSAHDWVALFNVTVR